MRAVRFGALFLVAVSSAALADAPQDRFGAAGYFRIMTRPDFEGGDGRLGYSNLYGRLLNEGPWGALELKLDVLQAPPGTTGVWASVHTKVEGGSFANSDPGRGQLGNFRFTQLYVRAGNVLLDRVTWQLGTLEYWVGDLGLYDVRGAQLFRETVGFSGTYSTERFDLLLGLGDSGFEVHGPRYNTVLTGGGLLRVRLVPGHLEMGAGGAYYYEPSVRGNRNAPYFTPGVRYEDYVRREVVQRFLEENPGQENLFPRPQATSASSYSVVGYLGFGKLGPLLWSNLFLELRRAHPLQSYTESFGGADYVIYLKQLTDEIDRLSIGNEMQFRLIPKRLDAVWSVLYLRSTNPDNVVAPGEDNWEAYSTVLRLQLYLTSTVHLLAESSVAREKALLGNLYREHANSVFRNTAGVTDSRGLEFGDSRERNTWQLKGGVVLNPTGFGIYTRPSLRLLYGLQYSNQQAAFGNAFVDSLDQYNLFPSPERHFHSVVAIEAEGWF
jgi:hypothetical protein